MDVLKVVQQLRDLAVDPQNRATIVRDQGCLPGLVIFLDNDNPQVVLTALEYLFRVGLIPALKTCEYPKCLRSMSPTLNRSSVIQHFKCGDALHYLAQVPSNRPLMKNEVGLLISVRRIMNRQHSSPELKRSAQRVHDLLIPPAGAARPLSQSRASGRGNVFLGASNKRAILVILQIEGLKDLDTRRLAEEQLLHVRGVISFTFNMSQQRCTLRIRSDVKPEVLCQAVSATEVLKAQQVVKNEHGEEVLLSFGPSPEASVHNEKENKKPVKSVGDSAPSLSSSGLYLLKKAKHEMGFRQLLFKDSQLPEYLPEDEEREKCDEKAIERSGAVEQGGGWFRSVSNFLSNSFYW